MPQINKAIPLRPQSSKSPIYVKQIVQISENPNKLFAKSNNNPIAIGTKGTVGSLIMQEIDYFTRLELSGRERSYNKPQLKLEKSASLREFSRLSKLENVISIPVIKKKGSNRLIPSMCSTIQVAERSNKMMINTYSKFSYRSLKSDVKRSSQP